MKKWFILLCKFICLLILVCDSAFSQTVLDTLHAYPDTTTFYERGMYPWTDDISNLAVKISLPDTLSYQITSLLVLISPKIDTSHHPFNSITISVGDFPEQKILSEKYVQTSTYYPFWQTINFDTSINLQGYKYFYVSGSLMFVTSASSISDSPNTNIYRYNETHMIWQVGTPIYIPIQVIVEKSLSAVEEKNSSGNILQFQLFQNYPNPFNPSTTISYTIPKAGFVSLKVYDVLGKEVSTLVNKEISVGNHEVVFNGSNLSSGIYFYRMQAGSFNNTKKLILLK